MAQPNMIFPDARRTPCGGRELDTRPARPPIISFDGVCGMCNAFVDLILDADRKDVFRFAPPERDRSALLPAHPAARSMLDLDERRVHDQSDASLEVYRRLAGIWATFALLRFVPRAIRNPAYRLVARNRHRWFGRRETCRLDAGKPHASCRSGARNGTRVPQWRHRSPYLAGGR